MRHIIKDKRTIELARRLARMTGETVTDAVATAIEERLVRIEKQHSREKLLADVRAISARVRKHLDRPVTGLDHGALLYDDAGLPK